MAPHDEPKTRPHRICYIAAAAFVLALADALTGFLLAQGIADMHVNRWVLGGMINVFLLVCGFFIPPPAIILMTAPIL